MIMRPMGFVAALGALLCAHCSDGAADTSDAGGAADDTVPDASVEPRDGARDARIHDTGEEGDASDTTALDASRASDAGDATAAQDAAPPFAPCPPSPKPCVIMPVGDSITAGYNSTTGGGYRLRLLHRIWEAGHDATFVGDDSSGPATLDGKPFPKANEGYSGYTIDDAPSIHRTGISPLVPGALDHYHPHVVLLMIGTNDVGTNNDLANAPARLSKLLDAIVSHSPDALLIVAQITPPGDDPTDARAKTYNAAIPELVKTRADAGKHVALVDMFGAIASKPNYRTTLMNGLHPNDAGYDVLGDAWFTALSPHL